MPWIRFNADRKVRVTPRVVRQYRAGRAYLVSQACARAVLAAGAGAQAARPARSSPPRRPATVG